MKILLLLQVLALPMSCDPVVIGVSEVQQLKMRALGERLNHAADRFFEAVEAGTVAESS